MLQLELDEGVRAILRDAAVKTYSAVKVKNKALKEEAKDKAPVQAKKGEKSKVPVSSKSKKPISKSPPVASSSSSSSSSGALSDVVDMTSENKEMEDGLKALGPEPAKGSLGSQERFFWSQWDRKKKAIEDEYKRKLEEKQKLARAPVAKVKAKPAKAKPATKKSTAKAPTKTKVKAKAKTTTTTTTTTTKSTKSKPVKSKSVTENADEMEEEEDEDEDEADEAEEENEFSNLRVATRAPSKNAKGHSRRLGKSKRSSDDGTGELPDREKGKNKSRRTGAGGEVSALQEMNSMNPVLPGAAQLFQAQRTGGRGLRAANKAHSGREALMPSDIVYRKFQQVVPKIDPLFDVRCRLQTSYLQGRMHWLWQLQLNFNLLFFGVGCKRKLLEQFAEDSLEGEDVLLIDGSLKEGRTGNRVVRALLDSICTNKLKIPTLGTNCLSLDSYVATVIRAIMWHYQRRQTPQGRFSASSARSRASTAASSGAATSSSTSAQDAEAQNAASSSFSDLFSFLGDDDGFAHSGEVVDPRDWQDEVIPVRAASLNEDMGIPDHNWGGRYVHALPRLYILVNAIDGVALQSVESQRVLAALAECPAVGLIASADKLNAPLLWSNQMLDQYRWYYVHTPTYESHELSPDFALLHGNKGTAQIQASALETILNSLTMRHKELFTLLAKESLKDGQDNARGVPLEQLLDRAIKAMLVTTSYGLNNYLKEFADHKVILKSSDANKKEWVRITLPRTTIEQMLQS